MGGSPISGLGERVAENQSSLLVPLVSSFSGVEGGKWDYSQGALFWTLWPPSPSCPAVLNDHGAQCS